MSSQADGTASIWMSKLSDYFLPADGSQKSSNASGASPISSQIIHLNVETDGLPPCPDGFTRFVLLSDTHTHRFKVPGGPNDILLHAGDLTEYGDTNELRKTVDWLCALPHNYKIIIAGNHDHCLDKYDLLKVDKRNIEIHDQAMQIVTSDAAQKAGLIYLQDSLAEVRTHPEGRTWKIWGSPWSAAFCSMAFNVARGESSKDLYTRIPDDVAILMSHGPPYQIFDKVLRGGKHVGCTALAARTKEIRPRLHCWGHIHEDRGAKYDAKTGTVYVNAANAGNFMKPRVWGTKSHQPIVVDLRDDVQRQETPSL